MAWLVLGWIVTVFIVANYTPPKTSALPVTHVMELEKALRDIEKPGCSVVAVQRKRFALIIEYINSSLIVKARTQLLTYRNWLDTNKNLSLAERIEMHHNLAIIHTSLNEFEPAVNEYNLILQDLAGLEDIDSKILKARYLNNRGVANYLLSQSFKDAEPRKKHLSESIEDLRNSQSLIASIREDQGKTGVSSVDKNQIGYIDQIVLDNENTLDRDMLFTPVELQP